MKKIFITGIAGFIGFHLSKHLQANGYSVSGCDNFSSYYDTSLKRDRAKHLSDAKILVHEFDIRDQEKLQRTIKSHQSTHLVHLAAQPGVRASLTHPQKYLDNNLDGFGKILEVCRSLDLKLTYASSSSVYGLNKKQPFSESDPTDSPSNLYGATKKANELMAYSYHHLYQIPVTGLRFFTAYGPWGRPDMAYYSFAQSISKNLPIKVFNHGKMERDFTYIDDIVAGIQAAIDYEAPCEIFNLGNHTPEPLMKLIHYLENALGKKAIIEFQPMQKGEVLTTFADIEKSSKMLGFTPQTSLESGIEKFIEWFATYAPEQASSMLPLV